MKIWGITAQVHDAAIAVIENGEILFAASSERYSKIKQDPDLNQDLIDDALFYGKPDVVAYYESPWLKKSRQFLRGQFSYALDFSRMPQRYLQKYGIKCSLHCVAHHKSHAAAGFYTSPYREAAVVVIDSLGEWQTISIWKADEFGLTLIESVWFPSSLGLLYSSFTKRVGLKPNEEEYILMGMAAYGKPIYADQILEDFIDQRYLFRLKKVCHMGIGNYLPSANFEDLAASIQVVTEFVVNKIVALAKKLTGLNNLVYMGGVALNCVANSSLFNHFEKIWIMPSPGDSGSSIGCAAVLHNGHLNWRGPYLGRNIQGEYPIEQMCDSLARGEIIGIAKGRAEFGPRALGNRSLLADPRNAHIKDRLNEVKRRQKYRPFAPAIPIEFCEQYFSSPVKSSPYMQFVGRCKFPHQYPGIVHVDGTSRIQTVKQQENPEFHALLMAYYDKTGCPMLVNTSLNIRGKPIVNDESDAIEFENLNNVKVF